jgi:hypothetical protein
MSHAYRRSGYAVKADQILGHVVEKAAANFYLLPELYNAVASDGDIGKYTGAVPMVGYGAGAYIMTVLDRSGGPLTEPSHCGDDATVTLPRSSCASILENLRLRESGDGPSADGAADDSTPACVCRAGHAPLSPLGAAFLLGVPALLLARRRRPA